MMEFHKRTEREGSEGGVGDYQPNPDKTAPTSAVTVPEAESSAPSDSRENRANDLIAQISKAIYDHIAPSAGTRTRGGPAELAPITTIFMWLRLMPQEMGRLLASSPPEADVAAAIAMFPAGVRGLITARVDARVRASSPGGRRAVSILQCNEPEFLFQELTEPYDATHALHLVCDPAKDSGFTFVMVELSAGKFVPRGWVDGKEAAQYAAEGAKAAKGRPPDVPPHDHQIGEMRTQEHMEPKVVISFDVEQVAAALEDAGFEISARNVIDIVDYINNGGESTENFDAAFRTLIAAAATDLKIQRAASASRTEYPKSGGSSN